MKITRRSPLSGKDVTMDIPCTQVQYNRWMNGELIQNAMPNVPAELREFLISGFTPEEFKKIFSEVE